MQRPLAAVVLLGLTAACGPTRSTAYLLDADVEIQAAKTAGADKAAPYEYTSANLYLLKAREEVGYSDFETALDFAEKAAKFAKEARAKAMDARNKQQGGNAPVSPAP